MTKGGTSNSKAVAAGLSRDAWAARRLSCLLVILLIRPRLPQRTQQQSSAIPVAIGSATATLAATLATLPDTSSAHGKIPPRPPDRESASRVVEGATIIPSTDSGLSAATHPGCPVQLQQQMHVQIGNCLRNQRQQRHAPGRGPPDS
jgi:hypothetical protein